MRCPYPTAQPRCLSPTRYSIAPLGRPQRNQLQTCPARCQARTPSRRLHRCRPACTRRPRHAVAGVPLAPPVPTHSRHIDRRRPLLTGAVVPMRVLLLNYEYPPCGSGAGLATEALAEGLAARGVTVDVVPAAIMRRPIPGCSGTARPTRRDAHGAPGGEPPARGARRRDPRRGGLPRGGHADGAAPARARARTTSCISSSRCRPPPCCRCSTCTARRSSSSLRGSDVPGYDAAAARRAAGAPAAPPAHPLDLAPRRPRGGAVGEPGPARATHRSAAPLLGGAGRRGPEQLPPASGAPPAAGWRHPLPRGGATGRAERPGRPASTRSRCSTADATSSRSSAPGRTRRRCASGRGGSGSSAR